MAAVLHSIVDAFGGPTEFEFELDDEVRAAE
jgi:hypothetical protein